MAEAVALLPQKLSSWLVVQAEELDFGEAVHRREEITILTASQTIVIGCAEGMNAQEK